LHRGRIFSTAGDAILAEFGSAVEAVRCATDIQSALRTRNDQLPLSRQVRFRIGINLGDVMLQGSDLLGDGVNVAARLQSGAEPGGIWLSGSVYDQIRNKLSLSFKNLGERRYKNIPQPVRTYSITEVESNVALPAPNSTRSVMSSVSARTIIGIVVLLLVITAGYFAYSARSARVQQQAITANDGRYSGQVCLGQAPNDPARCYTQSGVINNGILSVKYAARDPGTTLIAVGEVSGAGEIKIEMYTENANGARLSTAYLTGSLRDGQLKAIGSFPLRTVTIDWHRN
jgi:hypothetical protein